MKEAIFIAHRIPFPPNKGEKVRAYHFLKFIAERYPTHLLCHIDEERDLEAIQKIDLPLASIHYHFLPRHKRKRRCLKAHFSGNPFTIAYFYDHSLQRVFNSLIQRRPIGLIFASCAPAAEYVFRAGFLESRLLLDFMDVDSEKWRSFSEHASPPLSWIYALEAKRLRAYERRIANTFDHVFLVTEAEARLFRKVIAEIDVIVIENGVDLERFNPAYQGSLTKTGPTIVFTGAMDYWPNAEGAIWFAKEIFPKIKQVLPKTRFYIVGKDPTRKVKRLSIIEGVEVTGFVYDIRDYIIMADVCVAPLKLARGIQNKVLEAMAMGKPVVTTQAAAEGINALPGKEILVANTTEDFIKAVFLLLNDNSLAKKIGKAARKKIELCYSWKNNLSKLESFI